MSGAPGQVVGELRTLVTRRAGLRRRVALLSSDAAMKAALEVFTRYLAAELGPLKDALRSRVWQHGRAKEPQWLVQSLCGGAFDAAHYTNYLKNKYTELYGL